MVLLFFALVVVVQLAATHRIELNRFDIFENKTLSKTVDISVTAVVEAEVKSLCQPLFRNTSDLELNRCVTMAFHTVRDGKMLSVREAATSLSMGLQQEVTDLALHYAHEQTAGRTVCMVGLPRLDSILAVLSSSDALELLVLLDSNFVRNIPLYKETVGRMASTWKRRIDVLVGNTEVLLTELQGQSKRRLCDVLHVEGNVSPPPSLDPAGSTARESGAEVVTRLVGVMVHTPSSADSDVNERSSPAGPLRVVWVRPVTIALVAEGTPSSSLLVTLRGNEYVPYNLTSGLAAHSIRALNRHAQRSLNAVAHTNIHIPVQWLLSSVWLQHSLLNPIANNDGFTGRTYVAPDQDGGAALLTEVLIGEALSTRSVSKAGGNVKHVRAGISSDAGAESTCSGPSRMTVIAITYTIRVFAETADGLRRALHSLGYQHVYVVPDLTLNAVQHLQNLVQRLEEDSEGSCEDTVSSSSDKRPVLLQIALGPHDFAVLLPHYVVFQMEQTWSSVAFAGRYKTRYGLLLSDALCILAYSYLHAALLRELGYPCVHVVPMYSRPAGTQRLTSAAEADRNTSLARLNMSDRSFDFTFYGGCSDRRARLLQEVRQLFPQCAPHPPTPASPNGVEATPPCFEYSMHCVGWYTGLFDSTRLLQVLQSRLVLNLHTDENSVLEAHRLNYLLSLGRCVISERSDDVRLDARYAGAVHLVDVGDMAALHSVATRLLGNVSELHQCEKNARDLFAALSADTQNLSTAIDAAIRRIDLDDLAL